MFRALKPITRVSTIFLVWQDFLEQVLSSTRSPRTGELLEIAFQILHMISSLERQNMHDQKRGLKVLDNIFLVPTRPTSFISAQVNSGRIVGSRRQMLMKRNWNLHSELACNTYATILRRRQPLVSDT